jgi:hypothetical protein
VAVALGVLDLLEVVELAAVELVLLVLPLQVAR